MVTVGAIEIDGGNKAVVDSNVCSEFVVIRFEVIVVRFELIDGGCLPHVGFHNVFVIDGGQADSSLVFCCPHEEGVDSICIEKLRRDSGKGDAFTRSNA